MLYRALKTLAGIAQRGEFIALAHLTAAQRAKLEAVGAVALISPPPLVELPALADAVEPLAAAGIFDAGELLEADPAALAAALVVEVETICRWADQARISLRV